MARFYDELTDDLADFIRRQMVFFVGSAALVEGELGRVNISPKGMDTFRVLSPKRVGYLDLTGSGSETSAHLLAGGRMSIMFCSFGPKPLILRLYGKGHVVRVGEAGWDELRPTFGELPGMRQIVLMDVESVQTSCGFAVPEFGEAKERPTLVEWSAKKGEEGLRAYRHEKNRLSIDGLPTGFAPAATGV